MKKAIFPILAILFGLSASSVFGQQRRPNLIIILADDMGYGDLSCFGHPTIRTPYLDQMAAEGMRFTQFYAAANLCTPSRAGLLTGRHPIRSGMNSSARNNLYPTSVGGLPASEITLAEALKATGYTTGMVGKWHLGVKEYMPTRNGFDYYYGIPYSNDMFKSPKNEDYPLLPLYRNEKIVEQDFDQDQLQQKYTREAVNFIRANKQKPFFLYYASNAPHVPLHASANFKGKSRRGIYGDVVQELDWSIGQVISTLKELKLDQNTLVVFCSDNGPWKQRLEQAGSAGMLTGGKGSTNEGGSRVPGIAWWPGKIAKQQIAESVVSALDLFPTFLALAGGKLPTDRVYDGKNVLDILTQRVVQRNNILYYYTREKLCAVRKGPWKAIFNSAEIYGAKGANTINSPALLYNLEEDPAELFNVNKKFPEILETLQQLFDKQSKVKPAVSQLDRT